MGILMNLKLIKSCNMLSRTPAMMTFRFWYISQLIRLIRLRKSGRFWIYSVSIIWMAMVSRILCRLCGA